MDVPGQINIAPARDAMIAPKNKKAPTAAIPRGISAPTVLLVSELRQVLHLFNIADTYGARVVILERVAPKQRGPR